MSFYDDFVADGECCCVCGELIDGKSVGYPRQCSECKKPQTKTKKKKKS